MFAGKSKYLIENYGNDKDVEAFSSTVNTRDNAIKSRAYKDKTIPCTKISCPSEMLKSEKKIIIVDEYQFLGSVEMLKDTVLKLKEQNKKIVMAGLDLLADGTEWSNYTEMKKLCDREVKLKAECIKCGKEASFTKLVEGDKTKSVQIEGGTVKYEPRCGKCYYE